MYIICVCGINQHHLQYVYLFNHKTFVHMSIYIYIYLYIHTYILLYIYVSVVTA